MVLFHLKITSANQRITLPHDIANQTMNLKKSIVYCNHQTGGTYPHSVLYIRLPWLSNYEVTSSTNTNLLPISFNREANHTESDYNIRFHAERVPIDFVCQVLQEPHGAPVTFGSGNDEIQEIHLWFEYAHNNQI